MSSRAESADPRAERVRTAMKAAALGLITQRRVEDISVRDITATAGVSRQVFYQHFTDRDDAVTSAVADTFRAHFVGWSATATDDANGARRRLRELAYYAERHRTLYRNLYPSAASERAADTFRAELEPACEILAHEILGPGCVPQLRRAYVTFLVGGFIEVLRQSVDQKRDATVDVDSLLAHLQRSVAP